MTAKSENPGAQPKTEIILDTQFAMIEMSLEDCQITIGICEDGMILDSHVMRKSGWVQYLEDTTIIYREVS